MEMEDCWKFVWCLLVLSLSKVLGFEGEWTIPLEHAFGGDGSSDSFRSRGAVKLVQSRPGGPISARFSQGTILSFQEKKNLLKVAAEKGFYRIRCPVLFSDPKIAADHFVLSFTLACAVVKSELSEVLSLSVDSTRQKVLSLTVQPYLKDRGKEWSCSEEYLEEEVRTYPYDVFNTTIRITDIVEGPAPDAQAYLQKKEKEQEERKRGEQAGDNRSFLAKYVGEVFLAAGYAFQKLGDLTLQLNSAAESQENMKWTDAEADQLKRALDQFATDLENISNAVQARTTKQVKLDLKRKNLAEQEGSPQVQSGFPQSASSSKVSYGPPPNKRPTTGSMQRGRPSGGKSYAAANTPRNIQPAGMSVYSMAGMSDNYGDSKYGSELGPPSF